MAYSRDAFIRDQQETRERQDQSETSVRLERDQRDMEIWRMAYHSLTRQLERARERARDSQRLERDGDMEDGLSQSNKIAGESQRQLETRER